MKTFIGYFSLVTIILTTFGLVTPAMADQEKPVPCNAVGGLNPPLQKGESCYQAWTSDNTSADQSSTNNQVDLFSSMGHACAATKYWDTTGMFADLDFVAIESIQLQKDKNGQMQLSYQCVYKKTK